MDFCCDQMRGELTSSCPEHSDRFACPDALLHYDARFREYGLIVHDGGASFRLIAFCPWCGSCLPASLRDRWFTELERLGVDPSISEVPERFRSDAWWSGT
jgi:ribosomal protein S27AE